MNSKPMFVGTALLSLLGKFSKAMYCWGKDGFKVVSYFTFWKRRYICNLCSKGGTRCPVCGCFLWAICHISTSKCKNWESTDQLNGTSFLPKPTQE